MKTTWVASLLLALMCWFSLNAFGEMSHVYSLEQYIEKLDGLSSLADKAADDSSAAENAIQELRGGWTLNTDNGSFDFSTSWLVSQFEKLQAAPNADVQKQILERIAAMRVDAIAYQQPAIDNSTSRAVLEKILGRPEFHQVHGPTWLDRLQYKISEWLFRLLSKFVGSSSIPVIGKSVVWVLVALAVLALACFVYREIKRNARVEGLIPEVVPVSAKNWTVWLSEAKASAANGGWRDAVHLAYWAGISFLEASGAWRPDQARTPREYLKLITASSELRPVLSTLTQQLEVTWYGYRPAGPESFAEALTQLEKLGCRE
jgi:hypothetical protein